MTIQCFSESTACFLYHDVHPAFDSPRRPTRNQSHQRDMHSSAAAHRVSRQTRPTSVACSGRWAASATRLEHPIEGWLQRAGPVRGEEPEQDALRRQVVQTDALRKSKSRQDARETHEGSPSLSQPVLENCETIVAVSAASHAGRSAMGNRSLAQTQRRRNAPQVHTLTLPLDPQLT